jgi:hypothetical protein
LDPLRHFRDGGGVRGPTQRSISQGGDPAGLELGAGWVEVAGCHRQAPKDGEVLPRRHGIDRGPGR